MLSAHTLPKKITYREVNGARCGTLHIEVSNSALATELLYKEEVIIEKLAVYFGYKAVTKVQIFHNSSFYKLEKFHLAIDKKQLSTENKAELEILTQDIEDEDLRQALLSLGREVLGKIKE
jgi:hypothetical protein